MFRKHVYQAAAVDDGGGAGGAAGVIADAGGDAGTPDLELSPIPEAFGELAPELAGVVREAKWENPGQAVKSYNDLLSLKGAPADRLLKLPGAPGSDEARSYLAQQIGVPEDASGYDLTAVTVPDGATDLREDLPALLHAAQVPGDVAGQLAEGIMAADAARKQAAEEAADAQFAQAKEQLTGEWGNEAPARWGNVAKAYKLLGLDDAAADRIALEGEGGVPEFFKRLDLLGSRMGEPADHGALGDMSGGGAFITAKQAEARIDELVMTGDPNDPKVRKEIDRLSAIARPGRISL